MTVLDVITVGLLLGLGAYIVAQWIPVVEREDRERARLRPGPYRMDVRIP